MATFDSASFIRGHRKQTQKARQERLWEEEDARERAELRKKYEAAVARSRGHTDGNGISNSV